MKSFEEFVKEIKPIVHLNALNISDEEYSKRYEELSGKIIERYPFVVSEDDTILGFYDKGWIDIWLEYCESVLPWYNSLSDEDRKEFKIIQTKEKFGEMRIYTSFTSEQETLANDIAVAKSNWTCCSCGEQPINEFGHHTIYSSKGYVMNYCRNCAERYGTNMNNFVFETTDKHFFKNVRNHDTNEWEEIEFLTW